LSTYRHSLKYSEKPILDTFDRFLRFGIEEIDLSFISIDTILSNLSRWLLSINYPHKIYRSYVWSSCTTYLMYLICWLSFRRSYVHRHPRYVLSSFVLSSWSCFDHSSTTHPLRYPIDASFRHHSSIHYYDTSLVDYHLNMTVTNNTILGERITSKWLSRLSCKFPINDLSCRSKITKITPFSNL
jgi:hypothetical protein